MYTSDYAIYNIKQGVGELFDVIFYSDKDGDKPVREFIKSLDVKLRAKVVSDLHRLEMLGNDESGRLVSMLATIFLNFALF